jgi:predicted nuclease of predicted toxin-antitoxin system
MKIVVDLKLSPGWADFLNSQDIAAAHWSRVGAANAPDTEIMQCAASSESYVLTNDLDFGSVLAVTHGGKPSVIQIRSDDLGVTAIGALLVAALRQSSNELADRALLTVDAGRIRLRLLPLDVR